MDLDPKIKTRHVKELSGGQKQRIAIARALVKNPKLILADEPTGNLDKKTSKTILNLLSKLSKNILVIIVSHNLDDARKYATRIIELSDGEIVSDMEREKDVTPKMSISNGVLHLPHNGNLTNKELKEINENLQNNKIKQIKQKSTGFKKSKPIKYENDVVNIQPQKMSFESSLKISKYFLKKRLVAGFFTILIISLLVFVLGLCQFFIAFDESTIIGDVLLNGGEQDVLLYKGFYDDNDEIDSSKFVKISDNEIEKFYNAGYTGNIYQLYLHPFTYDNDNSLTNNAYFGNRKLSLSGIYATESLGTLVCDYDYLTNLFGEDNQVTVLAGNLTDKSYGIIITDYIADSIINMTLGGHGEYSDVVGKVIGNRAYVNAVIKTNYSEKYSDFFKYLEDVSKGNDRKEDKDYYKQIMNNYIRDIQKYYAICYSINPNFDTDTFDNPLDFAVLNYANFSNDNINIDFDLLVLDKRIEGLNNYELAIEYDIFNYRFGSHFGFYTEDTYTQFEPITLTLTKYNGSEDGGILYTVDVTIKKLLPTDTLSYTDATSLDMFASEELYNLINTNSRYTFGLYFDDVSQLGKIYNTIEDGPYIISSTLYNSISTIGDIVNIFKDFFWLIVLGVAGVCIALLINNAYGNIKKRYYEIGVLKSLGATTKDVGFIFSLQTILAGICITIISTICLLTLCNPVNSTISSNLIKFVNNKALSDLEILAIQPLTLIINAIVILIVTILSCVIPLIKLNKIKPKNIIANKE